MQKLPETFASWTINPAIHSFPSYHAFEQLSHSTYVQMVEEMLVVLAKVLHQLEASELFFPEKLSWGARESVLLTQKLAWRKLAMELVTDPARERVGSIWLEGSTKVFQGANGTADTIEGVFQISYEFFIDLISIDTYSDVWWPVSYDLKEVSVERAKINSQRLEKCLLSIHENLFAVSPGPGEVTCEYLAKQIGFRTYYPNTAFIEGMENLTLEMLADFVEN